MLWITWTTKLARASKSQKTVLSSDCKLKVRLHEAASGILLGVASYRSSQPLNWDAKNLKVANSAAAQQLIHKQYRKGWVL